MPKLSLDLFAEDRGHEEFISHLVRRIASEESCKASVRVISARGGHGRALAEWRMYPRVLARTGTARPDLIIVAIDANCKGWNAKRTEIVEVADLDLRERSIVACPDPHIERWFLADPPSFAQVVGAEPHNEARKCERDRYKELLLEAVRRGRHIPTLGGLEFAQELVAAMDLYRASRREPSLGAFIQDLRDAMRLRV